MARAQFKPSDRKILIKAIDDDRNSTIVLQVQFINIIHISYRSEYRHYFFSPPSAFCTLPPILPFSVKFFPIAPLAARGPPIFSAVPPKAPSLVNAPPMAPFASKTEGPWFVSAVFSPPSVEPTRPPCGSVLAGCLVGGCGGGVVV